MHIGELVKRVGSYAQRNSPVILTSVAVVGTVAVAYLTGKAAYRSAQIIRDEAVKKAAAEQWVPKWDQGESVDDILTPKEKVELTWKLYIPAVGVAALTVTAIICARRIDQRRAAVVAAMYALSERSLNEYRAKVTETFGERKAVGVQTALGQDRYDQNPTRGTNVIVLGSGNHLVYEDFTGREFTSNWESIKAAEREINDRLKDGKGWQSLDDFYDILGLPHTTTSGELGWTPDHPMRMHVDTIMSETGGTKVPCIYFEYLNLPLPRDGVKPRSFRG